MAPIYNITLALLDQYQNSRLIVRAKNPALLVSSLSAERVADLVLVQLLDVSSDMDVLLSWMPGLPIEIVLSDPQSEAGKLYRVVQLLRSHPVRVVIPLVKGFSTGIRWCYALTD